MKSNKIIESDLEKYVKKVEKDLKIGTEKRIVEEALKLFPKNENKTIVAMKIALIDLTNSTNLNRNLGKEDGLDKIANRITEINFDKRVKEGDLTLVRDIAKWSKENIGKNLFSFASKYCLNHNFYCYNRDDYVIYDSIMCENLSKYITNEEYKELTGKKLDTNSFKMLKDNYDYEEYINIINYIINKNELSLKKVHRKLDWFIWYKYKKDK